MGDLVHYTYFRSSAAFRTRIALNLKGLAHDDVYVHLRHNGQFAEDFKRVNPQGFVPALVHDGHVIAQSLAIIEYLDEVFPEPALLPKAPLERARVRQLAYVVACDTHPVNNLRIRRYLADDLKQPPDAVQAWQMRWTTEAFDALEAMLAGDPRTGVFCHGDAPSLADICLIPQLFNGRGTGLDIAAWPTLARIEAAANQIPAFVAAHPKNQPDAE